MFFLQINEFNPQLMQIAADQLQAPNIQRLLALHSTKTITNDKEERFGLDPWVQWVSIHTGRPLHEHGIEHLGDVPELDFPQIWESLDQLGFRTGIWGAMNACRRNTKNCDFFFPDPWTFSEDAYPPHLNDLLALPRYYSKNYGDLSQLALARNGLKLLRFCLRPSIATHLLPSIGEIVVPILKHGFPDYLLFALFDLVNAKLFVQQWKHSKPNFSLLFLNSIAHLQHHKWTNERGLSKEMEIAFRIFDQSLGVLFEELDDEPVWLVANAFSQICTHSQNQYLYRQRNPEKFLRICGIEFLKTEQAMTNDGHVFFSSAQECREAKEILQKSTISGKTAFYADGNKKDPNRLFFQFIIWDSIPEDAVLEINNKKIPFYMIFEKVVCRTGSHIQQGDILSRGINVPPHMVNHEIYDLILKHFQNRLSPSEMAA